MTVEVEKIVEVRIRVLSLSKIVHIPVTLFSQIHLTYRKNM